MQTFDPNSVLDLLFDCRHQAGAPRMGTAEWEVASLTRGGKLALRTLTHFRKQGKITRGDGFCWLREETYRALCEERGVDPTLDPDLFGDLSPRDQALVADLVPNQE